MNRAKAKRMRHGPGHTDASGTEPSKRPVSISGRPTKRSGSRCGKTSDTFIPPQSMDRSVMAG